MSKIESKIEIIDNESKSNEFANINLLDDYNTIKSELFTMYFSDSLNVKQLVATLLDIRLSSIKKFDFNTVKPSKIQCFTNNLSITINDKRMVNLSYQPHIDDNLSLQMSLYSDEILMNYVLRYYYIHNYNKILLSSFYTFVFYHGKQLKTDIEIINSEFKINLQNKEEIDSFKTIVYNISAGFNQDIKDRCKPLNDFSLLLDILDKFINNNELKRDEAASKAIRECINNDIMAKFLKRNRKKIVDMFYQKLTYEEEIIEKGQRLGRFDVAKDLVSKEGWSLAEAASFAGLNETEVKKLAKELASIDAGSDS
jgi:hypothetical protein